MNLTYTRPGELRKPDVDVLPDGRIRITRYIAAGHGDRDYSEVTETVGTSDKGLATALLVKKGMARVEGKDAIVKTYEVLDASTETLVGLPDIQYSESGQKTMIYDYVQMSTGTYTPGTIGTTSAPGDATCILRTEQVEDDGTTRQIRRTFINKGLLQQSDETRNNGALLLKTFVYLNDAPTPNPPTGYTLINQRTENPNGLETTTYVYAKGNGQIGREDSIRNNGALLVATIRYLSTPSVTANPITTPSGYVLVSEGYADQDGYKIWTASYAQGIGEIGQEDESRNNGALLVRTIRYLSAPSIVVNPITTPVGYVSVSESYSDQEGHKLWTASYAQGNGQISQEDSTRNNGALLIRTIRYLSAPSVSTSPISTPLAYTLISESVSDQEGHRVWTSSFAKGNGEISRDTRYSQSTNQGTTGATVVTIRYLSLTSVATNPITPPAGTVLINEQKDDQDGYLVWTASYAKGTGTVSSSTETKNAGRLIVYRITSLGTAPSAPSATIGGTVTLISDSSRNDSGFVVYDRVWAEGIGEISRDTRYIQSSDQGSTGATVISIRYISDQSTTTNPITTPTGTVLINEDKVNQDGYLIWSASYAKGVGTVASSSDTRNGGRLVIYRRTALGAVPSTPSSTIGGAVTLISDTSRNDSGYVVYERTWAEGVGEVSRDTRYSQSSNQGTTGVTVISVRYLSSLSTTINPISAPAGTVLVAEDKTDQDGYRIWSSTFAKGSGEVINDVETKNGGRLKIYHKVALGSAPTAPSSTIGGTVVSIAQNSRNDSGYVIYDYTWAEGIGIVGQRIQYRDGGLRLVNRDIFVAQGSTDYSAYAPAGIEVDSSYSESDGVRRYSITCIQSNSGGDPTIGSALQFSTKVPFTYPGRAKAYYSSFFTGSYNFHRAYDVFMSPPVQSLVDSTTNIYYTATSGAASTSYNLWNPTEWATMRAKWIGWADSPRSKVEGLRGYIAANSGESGNSTSATDRSVLGDRVFANTEFQITLSGGPSDPGGTTQTLSIDKVPAFTSTSGTQYYRVTEVYAYIPPQPALPV